MDEFNLPDKIRDSVELTKTMLEEEEEACKVEGSTVEVATPQKPLSGNLSGLSPAEAVLVERSQDSVQVTKRRMQRKEKDKANHSDSEASSETTESPRVLGLQKKPKTRFFIAGEVSVPPKPERKSVGRRISEAFRVKSAARSEPANCSNMQDKDTTDGHVKFQKFPEIID